MSHTVDEVVAADGLAAAGAVPTPQQVLENARAMVPKLRERLFETEAIRKLPDETVQEAADAGIFSLLLPRSLGGVGGGLREYAQIGRILAHGHLGAAWTIAFLAEHNFMMARMPREAQDEVFQGGYALMAGVISPPGRAVATDGGYILNGYWGYATAVMHSEWIQVFCNVEGEPEGARVFLFPRSEAEIEDTWRMSGMQATGSHHIRVTDLFIPSHRTLNMDVWAGRHNPGAELHPEPVYSYALRDILGVMYPGMAVGAAEAMLAEYRERIERRKQPFMDQNSADTVVGQVRYSRAVAALEAAKALFDHNVELVVASNESTTEDLDPELRAIMKLNWLTVVRFAWESIELVARGSGSSIYKSDSPTQQYLRDMEMLLSHQTIDEDTMLYRIGEILLGRSDQAISGVI